MTRKNLNPFDLNRTEYAELLGITPNAVRMRLRHGKLEGEYILENGKYIFKAPSGERANHGLTSGQKTTLKKIYNRGNHHKARYPNEAFRKHNEAKMLAKSSLENKSYKNYGTGIYSEGTNGYLDNVNPYQHRSNPLKFTATNRGRRINKKGPYEI